MGAATNNSPWHWHSMGEAMSNSGLLLADDDDNVSYLDVIQLLICKYKKASVYNKMFFFKSR